MKYKNGFIKRFLRATPWWNIKWRLLYAFDHEGIMEERKFFMCEDVKAGEWIKVTKYGNANKVLE